MIIRWLGNSALEINGEKKLLIDPNYRYQPLIDPDYILVTHEHDDHIMPKKITDYPAAEVFAPESVFDNFELDGEKVESSEKIGEIEVTKIDCYNSAKSLGYYYNGLYHTGDAAKIAEPEREVKVLFTACFEDYFDSYLENCHILEPDLVIPFHYDPQDEGELEVARKLVKKIEDNGFTSRLLQLGQEILV